MMVVLLVAGIGLVLAGLLAIGFGIPIKEFSTGNTLIVTGAMGFCTGAIMIALWITVGELRRTARRFVGGTSEPPGETAPRPILPPGAMRDYAPGEDGFPFNREQPAMPQAGSADPSAPPPPWQDEAVLRDHPMPEPEPSEMAPPAPKPKRNLLFSSTSRQERDRSQKRTSEPFSPDLLPSDLRPNPSDMPPAIEPAELQPASSEDARPRSQRAKSGEGAPGRRALRRPPAPGDAMAASSRSEGQAVVTVLKSGVVEGMAYSLYSDGSIEAEMPEGMMRFASIDELRAHLDQRP
jgi:hypothetical protein